MPLTATGERAKSPAVISDILGTVRLLETQGHEPTFNTILEELSSKGTLAFHRSLRKYLDLLVLGKLIVVQYQKTVQPNIHPKQVYHTASDDKHPIIEAGEKALLLHGLNWNIPSPKSLKVKTDLQALALAKVSGNKVYAGIEDAIVQLSKKSFSKTAEKESEITAFTTALLATQKVRIDYLLRRAKEEGVEEKIAAILLTIHKTFTSPAPGVEDVKTLYELRNRYEHLRRPLIKSLEKIEKAVSASRAQLPLGIVTPNEVVEYTGKQLGLRG